MNEPKDTRDKVVNELLETERKYVQDLEILQVHKKKKKAHGYYHEKFTPGLLF